MSKYRIRITAERREQTDVTRLCAALVAMARLKQAQETPARQPVGVGDGS
jgi:hypothetical protein